jgi:hypothetical protein
MTIRPLLAVIVAAYLPGVVLAQAAATGTKPAPATPVTVTNTPLPVTVGGGVNVTGSVKVNNTDTNPVPVIGKVINAETTQLLYDQFLTIDKFDYRDNPQAGPIDVGGHKTIPVVLRRGSCDPCPTVEPRAYIQTVGAASSDRFGATFAAELIDSL